MKDSRLAGISAPMWGIIGFGLISLVAAASSGLRREEAAESIDFACYMDGKVTRTAYGTEGIEVVNLGQASEVWMVWLDDGSLVKIAPLPGEQCGRS